MNTEDGSGPSELELLKNRARLIGVEFSNNIGLETLKERVNTKLAEVNGEEPASPAPTPVVNASNQPNPLEIEEDTDGTAEEQLDDFDADIEEIPAEQQEDPIEQQPSLVQPTAGPTPAPAPIPPTRTAADPVIKKIAPIKPKADIDPVTGGAGGGFTAKPMTLAQSIRNEQMKLIRVRISNMDPKKADLPGEILTVANKFVGNVKIFVPYGEKTDDGWHIPYIIYKQLVGRKFLQIKTTKNPVTRQLQVTKRWVREFNIEVMDPLTVGEIRELATQQAASGSIEANTEQML